ncbi:MAG: inositol monophosphatase family protein [Betaproteobacteria bacterium]|nr:inositol monophosphatase family protein [Betaproteobacteria bacterium]
MPPDPKKTQDAMIVLLREVAREEILSRFLHARRSYKSDGSLCSEADIATQKALATRLPSIIEAPVIGEEMDEAEQKRGWAESENDSSGLWCFDPIDGTTNFINGLPLFTVSLAWMQYGKPRVAVTYNPISDEMFYAAEGQGSYLNGMRLPLRKVSPEIGHAIADIDFKRIPSKLGDRIVEAPPFYSQRNLGCSTLEWCYLAAGRLDIYLHGGQKLWDYAAGELILKEAGGAACTLEYDDFDAGDIWTRSVLAALHPAVFSAWKNWVRG